MARTFYWIDSLLDSAIASGGQVIPSLLGALTQINTRGITIERVILDLWIIPSMLAGTNAAQILDVGIGVVTQDAVAAGAVPDPNTSADRPARGWLYRTRCLIIDSNIEPLPAVRCTGDFRGKRKLDDGELVLVGNNTASQGTPFSVDMIGIVRVGYLMP